MNLWLEIILKRCGFMADQVSVVILSLPVVSIIMECRLIKAQLFQGCSFDCQLSLTNVFHSANANALVEVFH